MRQRWPCWLLCLPLALSASERIDPLRSHAEIAIRLRWLTTLDCRLRHFEGEISTLPDGRHQVTVRLDARALDVEGSARYTRWAQSREFFDVQRYPWVVFASAPFAPSLLDDGGDLHGELFLRGVMRPVRFELAQGRCPQPGVHCPIEVSGTVSRRAFGMDAHAFAVRDRVQIRFSALLEAPEP